MASELFLLVRVSPSFQLHLDSRYFSASDLQISGDSRFQVALRDDPLSRVIRKNMACELRKDEGLLQAGKVKSVQLRDNRKTIIVSSDAK
jgi:hypothetical protein